MSNTKILPDLPNVFYVRYENYEMSKAIQRKLFKLGFWRRRYDGGKSTVATPYLHWREQAYIECFNKDRSVRWYGRICGINSPISDSIIKYNDLMNMEA